MTELLKTLPCVAVLGGDMRQARLAELLSERGFIVSAAAMDAAGFPADPLECAAASRCVILPLPVRNGKYLSAPLSSRSYELSDILLRLRPSQLVLAGMADPETVACLEERGVGLIDYFRREELAVANAVPTAEGAIEIAMSETPFTISGSRCLVIGYGRIGRALSMRLAALGAQVTVSARKHSDRAWIESEGLIPADTNKLEGCLNNLDLIFNTVPAPVLNAGRLALLSPDCLIIDLASKPGGTDFAAAREMGLRAIHALSLPGKRAPASAGKIIYSTVMNIFAEQGVI